MKWIKDDEYIRGKTPMTKFNIRALSIAYLSIKDGDCFLDIGAGTGSVSIEASLQGARVWAIEREEEAIKLLHKNKEKFSLDINIIYGEAPKDLPSIVFDKCFIGGSGGELKGIFDFLESYLLKTGILCANFITLKNLNSFLGYLNQYNYQDIEVQLIQTSTLDKIGLLKGDNPIFLVKGVKA